MKNQESAHIIQTVKDLIDRIEKLGKQANTTVRYTEVNVFFFLTTEHEKKRGYTPLEWMRRKFCLYLLELYAYVWLYTDKQVYTRSHKSDEGKLLQKLYFNRLAGESEVQRLKRIISILAKIKPFLDIRPEDTYLDDVNFAVSTIRTRLPSIKIDALCRSLSIPDLRLMIKYKFYQQDTIEIIHQKFKLLTELLFSSIEIEYKKEMKLYEQRIQLNKTSPYAAIDELGTILNYFDAQKKGLDTSCQHKIKMSPLSPM